MNEKQLITQNDVLGMILHELKNIAQMLYDQLENKPESPNYKRPIQVYPTFNWSSIGAEVQTVNDNGEALTVVWERKLYTKRSKNEDIWFSYGTLDNGYSRLITFKEMKGSLPVVTEPERTGPEGVTTPQEDDFSDLFPEEETPVTPPPVANGSHSQAMQDLLEWSEIMPTQRKRANGSSDCPTTHSER
jgi:hypothetical protein